MAKMGRPLKYCTCLDMAMQIEMYFEKCDERQVDGKSAPEPYLISGLSVFLDLTTEGLREYGLKKDFSAIIKKAKEKICYNLEMMSIDKPQKATGIIFNLKSNHQKKESSGIELSGPGGSPIETINANMSATDAAKAYAQIVKS